MKTWIKRILSFALAVFLVCSSNATAFAAQGNVSRIADICEHPKQLVSSWGEYSYNEQEHYRYKMEYLWCNICNVGYFPNIVDTESGPHVFGTHRTYASNHSDPNPKNHYIMWIASCSVCSYMEEVSRQPSGCTSSGCVDLMSLEPELHEH